MPWCCRGNNDRYKTANGNLAFNNLRLQIQSRIHRIVTKPQAVIWPSTLITSKVIDGIRVTKPQAVIRPSTLVIAVLPNLTLSVTKPQAVIRPFTGKMEMSLLRKMVTKPQAVIRPFTLWLAHGSQSVLKAL